MELHLQVLQTLRNTRALQSWPAALQLLDRAAQQEMEDWYLPLRTCLAVGGDPQQAFSAVIAIVAAQLSIIVIDDLLDEDPRGLYQVIGMSAAANLAAAFQAAALEALGQDNRIADPTVKLAATQSVNSMILTTAYGQYLDSQNPDKEADYWRVVATKSAPFFASAIQIGALVGGASPEVAAQLLKFGKLYGEMIQIQDDLDDCMATPANVDWTQGRRPLPILFALTANYPARSRFIELRPAVSDKLALAEAQDILIQCGALSYCAHHLLLRYRQAQAVLKVTPLQSRVDMEEILEAQIQPVWNLLDLIGLNRQTLLSLS